MNKIPVTMRASPVFFISFTLEQVKSIMAMCELHYSAECKAAGRVGGFVYGWKNHLTYIDATEPTPQVEATHHQLDILSKICENPLDQHRELAQEITAMVWYAIRAEHKELGGLSWDIYAGTSQDNKQPKGN